MGSSTQMTGRDLLAVTLVVILWGLNFVPTKLALADFTPFQLGAGRFLLAAIPLIFLVPRLHIPVRWLLVYALSQGVGQFGFLFMALQAGISAALASVIMQTQIFFTALMGALLLGEVIPRSLKVGMGLAATGLMCFAASVVLGDGVSEVTAVGFLLTLTAASMWACANVVVKKIQATGKRYTVLSLVAWSSLISGVCFTLIAALFDSPDDRWRWLDASIVSWVSLLYLGWMAGGVAFGLWTVLLTRHPASRVAPFSLGIPVIGLLAGVLVLREQVASLQWVGSALVMSALVLVVASSLYSVERMKRRYRGIR